MGAFSKTQNERAEYDLWHVLLLSLEVLNNFLDMKIGNF
jgi:hypothetical protein